MIFFNPLSKITNICYNRNVVVQLKNPLKGIAHPKLNKRESGWVLILGSLFTIPAIAGDMYLPSLPVLVTDLHTTQQLAQLTISATMLGGACGQLMVGPLLDKFGRRHPVMIGLAVHVIMSLCCSFSTSVTQLIAFRFVQGAANASANVTAMAVHRDVFTGIRGAKIMSRLMLVVGVAPLFAPSIGTIMISFGGWRAVFRLLAVIGAVLLFFVWKDLPETNKSDTSGKFSFRQMGSRYLKVLSGRKFVCLAISNGLCQSIMMSWVMSAPFITQNDWKFSPELFSLAFACVGGGFVVGAQINSFVVGKFSRENLVRFALSIQIIFATVLLIFSLAFPHFGPFLLVPIFLTIFLHNFVTANGFSIAMEEQGRNAGTAGAVFGVCGSLLPSLIAPFVGFLTGGATSLAIVMLMTLTLNLLILTIGTDVIIDKRKLPSVPEL